LHIGNIKFEPVNSEIGYTIMGIFIGDFEYRGKGGLKKVLSASTQWLKAPRNISHIWLAVEKVNTAAVRACEKVGFVIRDTKLIPKVSDNSLTMVLDLGK